MRTREEIFEEFTNEDRIGRDVKFPKLSFEILLDIRELLQKPAIEKDKNVTHGSVC